MASLRDHSSSYFSYSCSSSSSSSSSASFSSFFTSSSFSYHLVAYLSTYGKWLLFPTNCRFCDKNNHDIWKYSHFQCTKSFIHLFCRPFLYSAPSSLIRGAPDYSTDILYPSFTPKRTGNCIVKDLPKIPIIIYVAAREGVEPTTLRLKVIVSTKASPRPTQVKTSVHKNNII